MRASTRSPAVSRDGAVVYGANAGDDSVSAVSANYAVGSGSMGISVTPDGSTLVVANNLSGTVSIVKTAASAYPKAPTKITVKSSSSKSATISWKKSKSLGVTGYVVTDLPGGKTGSTKKTTCTVKKLSGGTKYTFAVQTTSKYGAGVPRNSSTVTVKK